MTLSMRWNENGDLTTLLCKINQQCLMRTVSKIIKTTYRSLKRETRYAGIPTERVTPLSNIYRGLHPAEHHPLSAPRKNSTRLVGTQSRIQEVWIC